MAKPAIDLDQILSVPGAATDGQAGAPAAQQGPPGYLGSTGATPPAAASPPAEAAAAPTANDLILQHLSQGSSLGDAYAMGGLNTDPGSVGAGLGDAVRLLHDVFNPQPASPGPQSWRDWATKTYSPSMADVGKTYADALSYHLAPLAAAGVQKAGLPTPVTAEDLRSGANTASENLGPMGPVVSGLGYATSPLTYFGVGPVARAVGGAAKLAPEISGVSEQLFPRLFEGGTTASAISAAHTAGEGGSPTDIAKSAAEAFPVGATITGAVGSFPLGRSTAADVNAKTAADVAATQSQLENVKVPAKDLGFKVGGTANPSAADLLEYKRWAASVPPEQDPAGAAPIIQSRIDRALAQGPTADAVQKAQDALQRAQMSQTLERWGSTEGVPGVDVRAEAAEAMKSYPIDSQEFNALKGIAGVQNPPESVTLPRTARTALTMLGGGAGEVAGHAMGYPGGGTIGASLAQKGGDVIEDMLRPKGVSPLIQQQIARSYPTLTGQPPPSQGGGDALSKALMYLYLGGQR
jgi:hypothetical protein